MAYVRKTWKDAPDTSTPINAANLNHMEGGIAEADVNARNALNRLDDVDDEITQINSGLTDKQNKTDNSLATTSKTVVGAINELNSDLTASFDCGLGGFAGTITFTHTFTHIPAVVITPENTNPDLVWSVIITSITTSKCTYVIKYSANGVNWINYTPTGVVSYIAMIPFNS